MAEIKFYKLFHDGDSAYETFDKSEFIRKFGNMTPKAYAEWQLADSDGFYKDFRVVSNPSSTSGAKRFLRITRLNKGMKKTYKKKKAKKVVRKVNRTKKRTSKTKLKGPTLTFLAKSGKPFKKKFKSISSAKRAVSGWKAKGGRMKKNQNAKFWKH